MAILLRHARILGVVALAAVAGCVHAPVAPSSRATEYPPLPAAPLARHVGTVPGAAFEPGGAGPMERFVSLLTGVDSVEVSLFDQPFGLAAAPDGTLLVTDLGRALVLRLDLARGLVARLSCASAPWSLPMAVVAEADGTVLVADAGAGLVALIKPGGACATIGRGILERPTGLSVLPDRIFVADPGLREVVILSRLGEVLVRVGDLGGDLGTLRAPTAVVATAAGEVVVVDSIDGRLIRLDPAGLPLGLLGPGPDEPALLRPKAVAVDAMGRFLVSDSERAVVEVLDPQGRPLFTIGEAGDAPSSLSLPGGVAVLGSRLFVADGPLHRLQAYDLLGARS